MMTAAADTPAFAIVVMGVSGSGKSTVAQALAAHYGFALLDADDFHSVEAKAQMARGEPLTDVQREPWVDTLGQALRQCVTRGKSVVLAFSGLRAAHRARLRASGVPMRFVFLHGTPAVIAARLGARAGHFMPAALLDSQFEALQPPADEPDVVAVDIDAPLETVVARAVAGLEGR
ncbi:gluconokinase [Stenotrophomonas panacihumi]|uniref:Gluconokinase n=1 Tax=Stenotrophomonas panacihumi TaxID=676599 RepID=A0A0R0ALD9_9GAMM|nr:gluconokinase [Stenotrophomonas panacihumi]KRG46075.1 gluconokinase [Stenotrophomonas panacihumi]PTN56444.1 gluconokinase [Stenotrophomonas panacihumi]